MSPYFCFKHHKASFCDSFLPKLGNFRGIKKAFRCVIMAMLVRPRAKVPNPSKAFWGFFFVTTHPKPRKTHGSFHFRFQLLRVVLSFFSFVWKAVWVFESKNAGNLIQQTLSYMSCHWLKQVADCYRGRLNDLLSMSNVSVHLNWIHNLEHNTLQVV